jgi:cell wall-associated NlpC family hydrolase
LLPVAGLCIAAAFTPFTALADTNLDIGGTGVVAYANGDNVNLRVGPGPDEAVAGEVPEGSTVYVIDGLYTAADGSLWYQVESNGISGFMVADYLAREGSAPASVGGSSGDAVVTEQVYVRTGPSTADGILGNLQAGDVVTLTGNTSNGFYEIWYGDYVGYAYADYISPGGSAPAAVASTAEAAAPAPSATGAVGTYFTTDSVNLRAGASTSDGVIEVVPAGVEVSLTGYVSNGFSEVTSAYGGGWISSDYLSASAPAAPQATSAGQSIVNFAMQFQGYPYVWAGNTPSGFDCSGFTQYVVQNTLGMDITHGTELQMAYGSSVAWGDWQPGDLIFFTGTYEGGWITHVGIYIADGMMIHAENPGTGVVISDITSGYYANHYYAAKRIG